MFNIQPGQGLGFSASKQIALGLGTFLLIATLAVRVDRSGGVYVDDRFIPDVHWEAREIKEIMTIIIRSGILN